MQENIQKALSWRYGAKIFTNKPLDKNLLDAILEAGRMAPGAYGLQPYKLIHVKNPELRQKLREASFGQPKVTDASEYVVVAARTDLDENFIEEYVQNISKTRGVKREDLQGFFENMKGDILSRDENRKSSWAGRMAYISFGFMLETAALLGVDAGPMEGFINSKYDEILGLKEKGLTSLGGLALGYRDESDEYATLKKVRVSKEDFILEM